MSIVLKFDIEGKIIGVSENDMESIKLILIEELENQTKSDAPNYQQYNSLRTELYQSPVDIDSEYAQIGAWSLIVEGNKLLIRRMPPRSKINVIYSAALSKAEGKWKVLSFHVRRMYER